MESGSQLIAEDITGAKVCPDSRKRVVAEKTGKEDFESVAAFKTWVNVHRERRTIIVFLNRV